MTTAFDPIDLSGTPLRNRIAMAPMTRSRAYGPGLEPHRLDRRVLRAARLGRADHHRGHPALAGRPGLSRHPRAAQRRAGRRLARGDRRRARGGRPDLRPAHAHRPDRPPLAAARTGWCRWAPRRSPRGARCTPRRPAGLRRARGADRGGHPADRRGPRGRRPQRDRRRLRRGRGARRQRLPGAPVPRPQLQHAAPTRWGGASGAASASPSNWSARWPTRSAPPVRACGSPPATRSATSTSRRRTPRTSRWSGRWSRSARPTCTWWRARDRALTVELRKQFGGAFLLNARTQGRPSGPEELALIEDGTADMLSYGALFLANPDLPRRLAARRPVQHPRAGLVLRRRRPRLHRLPGAGRVARAYPSRSPHIPSARPARTYARGGRTGCGRRRGVTGQPRRRPSATTAPTADTAVSATEVTAKACAETCAPLPAASRLR